MRKQKNRNYKTFPINSVEDGLAVLGQLIIMVKSDLEKYTLYNIELNSITKQYIKFESENGDIIENTPIPESIFHNMNDKIMYRQMMLLKTLADDQKSSYSYKNLRRFLKSQNHLKKALPEKAVRILNDFLDIRNWSFHNSQSRFTAAKEVAEKTIPSGHESIVSIKYQLNPLYSCTDEYFDALHFVSLDLHMEQRIEKVSYLLDCMIMDYEEMYKLLNPQGFVYFNGELLDNTKVNYRFIKNKTPKKFFDRSDMTTQISMSIQQNKYDGTKEQFKKWTHNPFECLENSSGDS